MMPVTPAIFFFTYLLGMMRGPVSLAELPPRSSVTGRASAFSSLLFREPRVHRADRVMAAAVVANNAGQRSTEASVSGLLSTRGRAVGLSAVVCRIGNSA